MLQGATWFNTPDFHLYDIVRSTSWKRAELLQHVQSEAHLGPIAEEQYTSSITKWNNIVKIEIWKTDLKTNTDKF